MASAKNENSPSTMPGPVQDIPLNRPMTPESVSGPLPKRKAIVVGLYGIQGSGKTYLMSQLKHKFQGTDFAFYESSELIDQIVPGGLAEFKANKDKRGDWRGKAIDIIGNSCAVSGQVAVVSGHFSFLNKEHVDIDPVYTVNDLNTYTHILYIDTPAEVVAQRRQDDKTRNDRPEVATANLLNWQQKEKAMLRELCSEHGILLSIIVPGSMLLKKVSTLLRDFQIHNGDYNLSQAEGRLDQAIMNSEDKWKTVLVFDADRTLAAEDTGNMFWEMKREKSRLKDLFSSNLKYSYTAFRQVALLYEDSGNDRDFDADCEMVASAVTMYPQVVSILEQAINKPHIGTVVVTCGLRRVWEKILEKKGLAKTVTVIGGGRIADGYVVTAAVKGALVTRLREVHDLYVCTFGDGPLDLDMFSKANEAIVVVGDEQTRSKKMDEELTQAIDKNDLNARQALLPPSAPPRLDIKRLPRVDITSEEFLNSLFRDHVPQSDTRILLATHKRAAQLLATATRDAAIAGSTLRKAHARIGRYLAMEYLTDVIGLEVAPITHVQGYQTTGFRIKDEKKTTIVALMRGGEPMAIGVGDILPLAMYVHAEDPEDIKSPHLEGQQTVVLVDSVVNSGTSVQAFVTHVHGLQASIHIVIVAGVIQAEFIAGKVRDIHDLHNNLSVVGLRTSDTKFTGQGTNDTGNRLYNTTHMK